MIIQKINSLFRRSTQEETSTESLLEIWEEYLSTKPATDDLSLLFIRYGENSIHDSKEVRELVWKELKGRADLENRDLIRAVLYCEEPRQISEEAWRMLSKEDLRQNDLEYIVEHLGSSHPISQEIEERFGKIGKAVLEKINAVVR